MHYGEIYGLLGANGAGKTTTIKMLCGLLEPTQGHYANSRGQRGNLRSSSGLQRIGYMSQKFSLYDDLTIQENLEFFSGVYGVPEDERAEKVAGCFLSPGWRASRISLPAACPGAGSSAWPSALSIMHEPSVLFLDEPTSGVDPLARRAFWSMINRLADRERQFSSPRTILRKPSSAIVWA